MPSATPLPEFLSSRRHLAAGGVGLAVIVALSLAATAAPAPGVARAAAVREPSPAVVTIRGEAAVPEDVPTAATTSPSRPPAAVATRGPAPTGPAITALAAQGIPVVALQAYQRSAALQARAHPSCHLAWTLVAAIGAVESGHGTHGTHGGARLYADGQDLPHVIGPVLDGTAGNARIADTDRGVLDGDPVFDRAVGPMQFIPGTWAARGIDGNGDGRADPFNIVDAAATTGDYLCRYEVDLGADAGRRVAVFGYNHLDSYVATVLALDAAYAGRPVTTTSPAPPAPPTTTAPTSAPPRPAATPTRPSTPTSAPTTPRPTPPTTTPTTPRPTGTPACPTGSPTPGSPTPVPTPTTTATGCPTPSGATSSTSATASAAPGSSARPDAAPSATPTGSVGGRG